jgi:hypothetical protein
LPIYIENVGKFIPGFIPYSAVGELAIMAGVRRNEHLWPKANYNVYRGGFHSTGNQ